MRVHLSRQAIETLRMLGESGAELRQRIEDLKHTPQPGDARTIDDRMGRYEFFVRVRAGGVWVVCERSTDRGETVIRVTAIEQN